MLRMVDVGDEGFWAKRLGQIVDPTGGAAFLLDNEGDLVFLKTVSR